MPINLVKRLFIAHHRDVQSYLNRKLRDAELASDLTQETFLRCFEHGGAASAANERSYLFRVAHNLAVDHIRRQRCERLTPVDEGRFEALSDTAPSPETVAADRSDLRLVREILDELPERTRSVFTAVRADGLTYRQTSERLGISESSVQKHLAKALKHLMQRLRKES